MKPRPSGRGASFALLAVAFRPPAPSCRAVCGLRSASPLQGAHRAWDEGGLNPATSRANEAPRHECRGFKMFMHPAYSYELRSLSVRLRASRRTCNLGWL